MAHFYQWETKGFSLNLRGEDGELRDPPVLDGWREVVVSLGQNRREKVALTARSEGQSDDGVSVDATDDRIEIWLSQEATGRFREGVCEVQVNLYYFDRERDTSVEGEIEVRHNLHKKEMG